MQLICPTICNCAINRTKKYIDSWYLIYIKTILIWINPFQNGFYSTLMYGYFPVCITCTDLKALWSRPILHFPGYRFWNVKVCRAYLGLTLVPLPKERYETQITKGIHKRSVTLMVPNSPLFLMCIKKKAVWFGWKIPNLSIYHILVHTNRDIYAKIRTQQYIDWIPG